MSTTVTVQRIIERRREYLTLEEIDRILWSLARYTAWMCDGASEYLIQNDMQLTIADMINEMDDTENHLRGSYFIAIRTHGVEGSTDKQHVADRCKSLGEPVFTIAIVGCDSDRAHMTIYQNMTFFQQQ